MIRHAVGQRVLSPPCLPISPSGRLKDASINSLVQPRGIEPRPTAFQTVASTWLAWAAQKLAFRRRVELLAFA